MIVVLDIGGKIKFMSFASDKVKQVHQLDGFINIILNEESDGVGTLLNKDKIIGIFHDAKEALQALAMGSLTDEQLATHEIQTKDI